MRTYSKTILTAVLFIVAAASGFAQNKSQVAPETPNSDYITYQGRLVVSGVPATGNYDFQFKIVSSSGTVIEVIETLGVPVANGVFTARFLVSLSSVAPGLNQYMTVGVRQFPTEAYTPLLPAQPISAAPIALKAHESNFAVLASNAAQLNGVNANQYVLTDDARMTDARQPLGGNNNYIQNNLTSQQPASFSITGAGKADVLSANSYYMLNGFVVLAAPGTGNLFGGKYAGASNTTGIYNTYFGQSAGESNTWGGYNTFIGYQAGSSNTTGNFNTFVGLESGKGTTTGFNNVFVGGGSGRNNTTGSANVIIGPSAGSSNTTGVGNVMIGYDAGPSISTGNRNILIGHGVGFGDGFGDDNIAIGHQASIAAGVSNSVAVGTSARATASNQIVLGTNSQNTFVSGSLIVSTYPGGGSVSLCANPSTNAVSLCSSSQRFKDNIANFNGGLDLIKRLRPVSFTWKDGGMRDVGFVAEEVAQVEPLLATRDSNGDVQGVKYDRISAALVNAVNQQQTEIVSLQTRVADQQKQLRKQQEQIELLKRFVCETNARALVCKEK